MWIPTFGLDIFSIFTVYITIDTVRQSLISFSYIIIIIKITEVDLNVWSVFCICWSVVYNLFGNTIIDDAWLSKRRERCKLTTWNYVSIGESFWRLHLLLSWEGIVCVTDIKTWGWRFIFLNFGGIYIDHLRWWRDR